MRTKRFGRTCRRNRRKNSRRRGRACGSDSRIDSPSTKRVARRSTLGHAQAISAITHRLCRLIWKLLDERIRDDERGPEASVEAKTVLVRKMIRELRSLGTESSCSLVQPAVRPDQGAFRPWQSDGEQSTRSRWMYSTTTAELQPKSADKGCERRRLLPTAVDDGSLECPFQS